MNNLKNLLKTPLSLQRIPKWIPTVLLIVAFIGFADATYLTVKHFENAIPPCSIGGCESVLTSIYAKIFGIPVALFGAVYYLTLAISLFIFFDTKKEIFLRIPILLSVLGLIATIYFSFLQIFVIKAFCLYCAISALTSFIIFGISVYVMKKFKESLSSSSNIESDVLIFK